MAARKTLPAIDVVDVVLAAVVGVWAGYSVRSDWSLAAVVVVMLAAGSAFAWRRPRVCLGLALAALAAGAVAGLSGTDGPSSEWGVAMALVAGVSLGAFERARVAFAGVLLLGVVIGLTVPRESGSPVLVALEVLWPALPIGGATALAAALADARRRSCAQRARLSALAATSPHEVARLAVARERERVLADVHATLRAAVSAMLAHAEAAARTCDSDPPAAVADLQVVQRVGRAAVTELRVVLGQLRAGSPPAALPVSYDPGRPQQHRNRAGWPLTVGLVVLAALEPWIWGMDYEPALPEPTLPTTAAVSAAAAAIVGVRLTHPAAGAAALGVFLAVTGLLGAPVMIGIAVFGVMLMLTWSAMTRADIGAVVAVVVLLGGAVCLLTMTSQNANLRMLVTATVVTAAVSYATAHHRGSADSTAAHAAALSNQQRAASAEAVRAQRLSVARELHDVVSHAVVVMTLQAGAAEALLRDPAAARAALGQARTAGAATLAELDALFAALRCENTPGQTDPVNHDIAALVQRMRAGGLVVDLHAPAHLPTDPLVFRVVQETLTNTLRHAPSATVDLRITTNEQGSTVEAVDSGPGPAPGAVQGYGLVGITERVEHAGGRVETGPGHHGRGFRLVARIPTTPTHAAAT